MISIIFTGCEFKNIEVEDVQIVKVEKLTKGKVMAALRMRLINPNGVPVRVTGADFQILSAQVNMGTAVLKEGFKIPAHSSDYHTIELEGEVKNLLTGGLAGLMGALNGGGATITLKGHVTARSFLMRKTVPVEHEARIPLNDLF